MKTQHSAFLILSEHLTGFDSIELMGAGMLDDYYVCLLENLGALDPARLWSIAEKLDSLKKAGNEAPLVREIRHSLFGDAAIEPISKSIIRLWHTGTWRMKPDSPFSSVVVSPESYMKEARDRFKLPVVDDGLLLNTGSNDKSKTGRQVIAKYDVLLMIGDNIREFDDQFKCPDLGDKTQEYLEIAIQARKDRVNNAGNSFGERWIILPNPSYGEWTKPLGLGDRDFDRLVKAEK